MHLKKISILVLVVLACLPAFSQVKRQRTFGDSLSEIAFSARRTADKGFLLCGFTNGNGMQTDFLLVKTDSLFNVGWSRSYAGSTYDEAYSAQQTADLGYLAAGYTRSFGAQSYDALLLKTKANGDTLWTKLYGGPFSDYANAVIQTSDGGYAFAGFTKDTTLIHADGNLWLVKTDAGGNISWQKEIGPGTQFTDAYDIYQTTDKGFVLTGYTNGFADINGDLFLLKTDSAGTVQFMKTIGYKGSDWGNAVLQTGDGGYILTGSISTDSTSSEVNVFVIRTDANGDTIWTRTWGASGSDYGQKIARTKSGGYVVGGYSNSYGAGSYDAMVLGLNASGDTLFCNLFGGALDDEANDVLVTANGFALAGKTYSFGKGKYDFYWAVTDSMGNSSCHQSWAKFYNRRHALSVQSVTVQTVNAGMQAKKVSPMLINGTKVTDPCLPNDIEFNSEIAQLRLWPNPSQGSFVIAAENQMQNGSLEIYNMFGERAYATKAELPFKADLTLADGMYLVRFLADGKAWCERLLINSR